MALTGNSREFLSTVPRLKVYVLIIGGTVLAFLLVTPPQEMRFTTLVMGVALCGVFWLSQRLLTYISILDTELKRLRNER